MTSRMNGPSSNLRGTGLAINSEKKKGGEPLFPPRRHNRIYWTPTETDTTIYDAGGIGPISNRGTERYINVLTWTIGLGNRTRGVERVERFANQAVQFAPTRRLIGMFGGDTRTDVRHTMFGTQDQINRLSGERDINRFANSETFRNNVHQLGGDTRTYRQSRDTVATLLKRDAPELYEQMEDLSNTQLRKLIGTEMSEKFNILLDARNSRGEFLIPREQREAYEKEILATSLMHYVSDRNDRMNEMRQAIRQNRQLEILDEGERVHGRGVIDTRDASLETIIGRTFVLSRPALSSRKISLERRDTNYQKAIDYMYDGVLEDPAHSERDDNADIPDPRQDGASADTSNPHSEAAPADESSESPDDTDNKEEESPQTFAERLKKRFETTIGILDGWTRELSADSYLIFRNQANPDKELRMDFEIFDKYGSIGLALNPRELIIIGKSFFQNILDTAMDIAANEKYNTDGHPNFAIIFPFHKNDVSWLKVRYGSDFKFIVEESSAAPMGYVMVQMVPLAYESNDTETVDPETAQNMPIPRTYEEEIIDAEAIPI